MLIIYFLLFRPGVWGNEGSQCIKFFSLNHSFKKTFGIVCIFTYDQIKRMLVPQLFYLSGYIDGLGDAVEKGLVKAVGVSNYNGKSL